MKYLGKIKKNSFYPKPKVDAAWLLWERNPKIDQIDLLEILLRACFWGKRKLLTNALLKNPYFKGPEVNQKQIIQKWVNKVRNCEQPEIKDILGQRADLLNFKDYANLFDWLNR